MLKWPITNPVTAIDLDSHLYIPIIEIDSPRNSDCDGDSNAGDKCHLNYRTNQLNAAVYNGVVTYDYHIYTDIVSTGDNVTLDKDHNVNSSPASPPGDETITISKVRSGTYSFSVHNITDSNEDTANYKTNLSKSRAKVKVFYNNGGTLVRKRFHVPNVHGTLWSVFTFSTSGSGSGFTRVQTMTYQNNPNNVY